MNNNALDRTYKDVILSVLDAIDFTENKEEFANQFIVTTQMQAFVDLVETLPQDKQEEIKQKLQENTQDAPKTVEIITAFFTPEQIQKAVEEALKKAVIGWMEEITTSLNNTQKEKLLQLSKDLQQ